MRKREKSIVWNAPNTANMQTQYALQSCPALRTAAFVMSLDAKQHTVTCKTYNTEASSTLIIETKNIRESCVTIVATMLWGYTSFDDTKNRQNSISDLPQELKNKYVNKIKENFEKTSNLYEEMLEAGIAKECARFILPLATPTRIYMTGSCRSWIHYIKLRSANGTQEEHKQIALHCRKIFKENFPIVARALDW